MIKPLTLFLSLTLFAPLHAQGDADLAKKLTNPLADMISVPMQGNMDFGQGAGGGTRMFTNIQPVIPFNLNEDWNLISRTILPVVDQKGLDFAGDRSDAFGLGDTVQSMWFSPAEGVPFVWGIGPAFLLPTATDTALGGDKWGAGPTAVILKMDGPWSYGALANHIWDFAGDSARPGVNATYIQPFLTYTTDSATTFSINTETTYDWRNDQWTIPINLQIAQLIKPGKIPISIYAGVRYYVELPAQGPEWGLRFGLTMIFPKG